MKLYGAFDNMFHDTLRRFDYEIIFADDCSKDNTRTIIRDLCSKDKRVKAVFNMSNFGFSRNVFASMQEASGDAAFLVFGDMQDPPELLPEFIDKWEHGSKVVIGQKEKSDENKFMNFMRALYYKVINCLSDKPQLNECNGYGLYDQKFIQIMKEIDDVQPYLKTVISEYASNCDIVKYHHQKSGRGVSNFNFYKNYDFAMQGITSSTKKLMRMATFLGAGLGIVSAIYAISVVIRKILFRDAFPIGMASIMVGVFLIGAMELFFIGILGEYMLSINLRTMKKPRVVVDEKINFDETEDK